MNLSDLKPGESGIISAVAGEKALRRHLLDMGLTPHTKVMLRKVAPLGDPLELTLRGYELTLRKDDAEKVELFKTENPFTCTSCSASGCPYCSGALKNSSCPANSASAAGATPNARGTFFSSKAAQK
jgi:Fe2+ transport system protein FeoA